MNRIMLLLINQIPQFSIKLSIHIRYNSKKHESIKFKNI